MTLIDQLRIDLGDTSTYKHIRPFDIKQLGYRFGKRIYLRKTICSLYELLDEDTKKPISVCFLLNRSTKDGVIVPKRFSLYQQIFKEELIAKKRKKARRHTIP